MCGGREPARIGSGAGAGPRHSDRDGGVWSGGLTAADTCSLSLGLGWDERLCLTAVTRSECSHCSDRQPLGMAAHLCFSQRGPFNGETKSTESLKVGSWGEGAGGVAPTCRAALALSAEPVPSMAAGPVAARLTEALPSLGGAPCSGPGQEGPSPGPTGCGGTAWRWGRQAESSSSPPLHTPATWPTPHVRGSWMLAAWSALGSPGLPRPCPPHPGGSMLPGQPVGAADPGSSPAGYAHQKLTEKLRSSART